MSMVGFDFYSMSDGPTAAMETDALLLGCLRANLRQTDNNFEQFKLLLKRHFCSDVESAAHCG